ncbi:MAG: hypothetical protein M3Q19_14500 [Pseudomonadota bacterium]|nr:hypothetical protein [Pseudomonadota bacterium]
MSGPVNIEPPRQLILKDDEALASIGTPRVVVTYHGGSAWVDVSRKPWGWGNVQREFLNPESPGVMRYAQGLFARLAAEALAKDAYNGKRRLRNAIGREMGRLSGIGTPKGRGRL